jgi:hypothetical protein
MIKKTWMFAVCALFPFFLMAQGKYEQAYIVNSDGDTVRGQMLNYDLVKSPDYIVFRKAENAIDVTYTPDDIKGFSVGKDRYISVRIPDPSPEPGLPVQPKNVFLRKIVDGRKSLYYFTDETLKARFYIVEDNEYTLLIYGEKTVQGEHSQNTVKDQRYKGQLILYFQDCPKIQPKINSVTYSERDLKKLFAAYYECVTGEKSSYVSTNEKSSFDMGILGGYAFTHVAFKQVPLYHFITPVANATYDNSRNYSAGAYAELTFPKNHQKWSIFTDGVYSKIDITGHFQQTSTLATSYTDYLIRISVDQVQINLGARYKIIAGKVNFFADAGFCYTINAYSETSIARTQYYAGIPHEYPETPAIPIKDTEEALFFGLGVKYGRLSLETRFRYGDGFTAKGDESSTATSTYQLNAMLGFRIF